MPDSAMLFFADVHSSCAHQIAPPAQPSFCAAIALLLFAMPPSSAGAFSLIIFSCAASVICYRRAMLLPCCCCFAFAHATPSRLPSMFHFPTTRPCPLFHEPSYASPPRIRFLLMFCLLIASRCHASSTQASEGRAVGVFRCSRADIMPAMFCQHHPAEWHRMRQEGEALTRMSVDITLKPDKRPQPQKQPGEDAMRSR